MVIMMVVRLRIVMVMIVGVATVMVTSMVVWDDYCCAYAYEYGYG